MSAAALSRAPLPAGGPHPAATYDPRHDPLVTPHPGQGQRRQQLLRPKPVLRSLSQPVGRLRRTSLRGIGIAGDRLGCGGFRRPGAALLSHLQKGLRIGRNLPGLSRSARGQCSGPRPNAMLPGREP